MKNSDKKALEDFERGIVNGLPMNIWHQKFHTHMKIKKFSPNSLISYNRVLIKLNLEEDLSNWEEEVERYFISVAHNKASTVRAQLSKIMSFQTFLLKSKFMSLDQEVDIEWKYAPKHVKKNEVRIVSPEEKERIFKSKLELRDKLALTILLKTGVRDGEFENYLNDPHALLENDLITIEGKSIEARQVYICKDIKELAQEFIDKYPHKKQIWPQDYTSRYKRIKNIGKKTNIRLNPHMFRATFATEWVHKGFDIMTLQVAMGHSSLAQLEWYVNKNQLKLKETWEKFTDGDDYTELEFLKSKIKMLESKNRKLQELLNDS